ncbi:ankyrin repeat domain-containing protein [Ornithinibacillus salinisoli]|uniref:Ankyrin repeat domain-containing protein n=1 Tax=Ornithinibacillus salinisoli TaxID=1848459 RepID=A0ABW4VY66_9BACI
MKNQNRLEQLDERLKSMPKPDLNQHTKLEIKQAIQNTNTGRFKYIQKLTVTLGTVLAVFIFSILIMTNINEEKQVAEQTFHDFLHGDTAKIVGYKTNEPNVKYASSKQEIIQLFDETVGAVELTETVERSSENETTIELYDSKNELLNTLKFTGGNIVTINGDHYHMNADIIDQFTSTLFTEEYMVVSDEEDEETVDYAKVLTEELEKASENRNWDNILDAVENGADPNAPLLIAAKENRRNIVEELLRHDANPNTLDDSSNTPLMLTTDHSTVELLLEHGADHSIVNTSGHNALILAIYRHQHEIVISLLDNGADPNTALPNNGMTVLQMAGAFGDQELSDILLQYGADEIEGYEIENWMISQIPSLSLMLDSDLVSYASIGRLPGIDSIQIPSDARTFQGRFGDPFETFTVDGDVAHVYGNHTFIKLEEQDLFTTYRYELHPGDQVSVQEIIDELGWSSNVFVNESTQEQTLLYDLVNYEIQFAFEGEAVFNEEGEATFFNGEGAVRSLELTYKQPGIVEHAHEVLELLIAENMNGLADEVHPEKGVLFGPFLQIDHTPMSEDHEPVTFDLNEVSNLFNIQETFHWGDHAASGLPIVMTTREYFDSYVKAANYVNPDGIYVNEINSRGDYLHYVSERFPDSQLVEYFHDSEDMDTLNWGGLGLLFEEYNNSWKLVAILHDEWTP